MGPRPGGRQTAVHRSIVSGDVSVLSHRPAGPAPSTTPTSFCGRLAAPSSVAVGCFDGDAQARPGGRQRRRRPGRRRLGAATLRRRPRQLRRGGRLRGAAMRRYRWRRATSTTTWTPTWRSPTAAPATSPCCSTTMPGRDRRHLCHRRGHELGTLSSGAGGVLRNDTDPEGDTLMAELEADPEHGRLTFNATAGSATLPDRPIQRHRQLQLPGKRRHCAVRPGDRDDHRQGAN